MAGVNCKGGRICYANDKIMQKVDISFLKKSVIEAGKAIMQIKESGINTRYKEDMSPVTEADEAAEKILIKELNNFFPKIPVISEENKESHLRKPVDQYFLVDPLDGTKEFIKNNSKGSFTVNIGLVENNRAVAGIIYAPMLDELYLGDKNGAKMLKKNIEEKISVRKVPIAGPVALASKSHRDELTDRFLLKENIQDIKSVGSSLKFVLLASGNADIYPRYGPTMEWDTAAGEAILVAAGGNVFFPNGEKHFYGKKNWRNESFFACGGYLPKFDNKNLI